MSSCGLQAQNISLCEDQYQKEDMQDCFACSKNYLKSNPLDLDAMMLIVKCAQSKSELEFVDKHMRQQYNEHEELFKEKVNFWITHSDLLMKLDDPMSASAGYMIARNIDSNFKGINYKLALAHFTLYSKENNNNEEERSDNAFELTRMLNYINQELVNNPGDTASLTLQKKVEALMKPLK